MITLVRGLTTLELPNPTFSNSEQLKLNIRTRYDMTGQPYTFKRGSRLSRLVMNFTVFDCAGSNKTLAEDLTSFIEATGDLTLTDHRGDVWTVKCVSNPVQFSSPSRDRVQFTLEFEGSPDA